jgi:hypothetical protein
VLVLLFLFGVLYWVVVFLFLFAAAGNLRLLMILDACFPDSYLHITTVTTIAIATVCRYDTMMDFAKRFDLLLFFFFLFPRFPSLPLGRWNWSYARGSLWSIVRYINKYLGR